MPSSGLYTQLKSGLFTAAYNFSTDTVKCALVNGYAPNFVTDTTYASLTSETVGTGYSSGGIALSGVAVTTTQGSAWTAVAGTASVYKVGQYVRPAAQNGFAYRCVVAGTSGVSPPAWPTTVGTTVADGTATWACVGTAVVTVTSSNPSWGGATFAATGAVLYDATAGNKLISYIDFNGTSSVTAGTFTVTLDPVNGWLSDAA